MSDVPASLPKDEAKPRWRLSPGWRLLICFAIAFLLVLSRRLHPFYPYAEDGTIFYQQADELGIRSLFLPYGGYLHVALRILSLFLVQFPPSMMPYVMVSAALAIQAGIAAFIYSDEISNLVPSQFYRGLFAFTYIGLPDINEVFGHFVNSQWHLAILSALLIFGRVPATRRGKVVRLALIAILSLTGPFVAFLLPLVAFKYFRSRRKYNLALLLAVIPSCVQIALVFLLPARIPHPWADLLRPLFIPRTFGGRGLLSAAIAPSLFDQHFADTSVVWAATFGAFVLCVYAVFERKRFASLLLYLGLCIILTSFREGIGSIQSRLDTQFSNRYYFTFGFGLIATVVLMFESKKRWVQVATAGCMVAMLSVSWQLHYPIGFWPKYQAALRRYDRAKRGTEVVFPEWPQEWSYQIRKR